MKRLLPVLFLAAAAFAAEPAPVRRIPPPGIEISQPDRDELTAGAAALGQQIAALEKDLKSKPELLAQLPDVQIFHKAVDWALRYDEFFDAKQVAVAKKLLELGNQRAAELRAGKPSWNSATGLVVRGYKSRIDGSIQPYGLIIPDDWKPDDKKPRRLDFWAHGRAEKLSELAFVEERLRSKGEFQPPGAIVLHLYGRFCCANKFAGEVDLFEALTDAKKHYPIDDARLVIRGFSMGGASAWQFGTHFAGMWAAVQPGAGFAESKEFLKLGTSPDKPLPSDWEQKLWRWYDSTGYVANLANTTTVAYSGEIDAQKQAADIMIRSARQEASGKPVSEAPTQSQIPESAVAVGDGSPSSDLARVAGTAKDSALYHVTAPKTPHKIIAEAKPEIEKLVGAAVGKGREAVPKKVHFTTYSLIYPKMDWVEILALEKQWERADLDAEITASGVTIKSTNVGWLRVHLPKTAFPKGIEPKLVFNGTTFPIYEFGLERDAWSGDAYKKGYGTVPGPIYKSAETCGPIDHAFMDSFVFVRPTGKPLNDTVGTWAKSELDRAVAQWRQVFRGEARVVDDTKLSQANLGASNLILWGDPSSNAMLKKILAQLPLKWDARQLVFAGQTYDAAHTAPILIFPNPLNPSRYVVLNSGFTFREAAALNNAQQTPKLPDWAIVDLNTPPDANWPGKIVRAGFFDEQWRPPAP